MASAMVSAGTAGGCCCCLSPAPAHHTEQVEGPKFEIWGLGQHEAQNKEYQSIFGVRAVVLVMPQLDVELQGPVRAKPGPTNHTEQRVSVQSWR